MFLISTRNFPPELGGIQNLMEGLSNALLDHGPVKVFADSTDNADQYDRNSKLNIQRVSGFKIFRKYRKANLVKDFIENNNLRASFFDHWKSIEIIDEEVLKKTKTFCLIHSKEINHEIGSSLNKRIIKCTNNADFIIANSNFTKELAIKIGINPNKIKIIHPGINKPKKIEQSYKNEAKAIYGDSFPKIITVSRLDKRKGHDKILMIIKNLKTKFPKIKYVSIGFGDQENDLIKLSKELNINNDVIFLKNINFELKIALLSESNLFLMPSRIEKRSVEGFGISFIEAGTYGVGSIGGIDGGAPDAIKNNKTGLICDGNNLDEIYFSLNSMIENKKYLEFGKNAKEYVSKFEWSRIIEEYKKILS